MRYMVNLLFRGHLLHISDCDALTPEATMAQHLQFYWPPFTRNIKITLVGLFTLWFASVMIAPLGAFVDDYMLLSRSAVIDQGQIWTLLTYAFWHADFTHLLFNGFVLWMFGAELDQRWSAARWWRFTLLCALGGGLTILASQLILSTNFPTLGFSAAVMGVVAAFAWRHWNDRLNLLFLPVTGKTMLLVFIGLDILFVVAGREAISIAGHLGGMATGLLIASDYWRPSRIKRAFIRRRQRRNLKLLRAKDADKTPSDRSRFN
ncbi:rhomboid family intramembrane serine protease [Lujinxingia sediminis]|uniref:Rhomboid family intramembrane serine protease n=1 Tax=Lujinxingia sediminis TaxID=2480984 RepID=A0ABY0CW97_9DELT|nr:rhomboid family intramembrane serine protease [Lujinxingia sediminis]RVU46929.1 rhomboid family intramembrane serine protease [Lujinxingia sediminis]